MPGYNKGGRGFPDVAMQGYYYLTLFATELRLLSGTSASCPAVAGFISNLNAARMRIGKGSVGFLNPALYAYSGKFTNDVIEGNNRCLQSGVCCTQGFTATPGWDPASGLGSLNYGKMKEVFISLGNEVPTNKPANNPTTAKSSTFDPTNMPTSTPTAKPTSNPTYSPSVNPSASPTVVPSATPTSSPSSIPTDSPTCVRVRVRLGLVISCDFVSFLSPPFFLIPIFQQGILLTILSPMV